MNNTMLDLLENIRICNNLVSSAATPETREARLCEQHEFITRLQGELQLLSLLVCIAGNDEEDKEERDNARDEAVSRIGAL